MNCHNVLAGFRFPSITLLVLQPGISSLQRAVALAGREGAQRACALYRNARGPRHSSSPPQATKREQAATLTGTIGNIDEEILIRNGSKNSLLLSNQQV